MTLNKQTQTDALRGERIWDGMFDCEQEIWLRRFFQRVAPWVDPTENGDQHLSGSAMWSFNGGRVAALAMADGRTAYDGWESMLIGIDHCIRGIQTRKKQLPTRGSAWRLTVASRLRALTRARIIQMIQEEGPAFASHQLSRPTSEFIVFINDWSFRAGALLTFAIAEGKETKAVINEVVDDAFVASKGKFVIMDELE